MRGYVRLVQHGPQDVGTPFTAMRDALNKTGRPIVYAIHSDGKPWNAGSDSNGTVANMWRTGGDLSASNYDMWLNRLDLATDPRMAAFVGPGAFANPDFLEVGYTPRQPKNGHVQSLLERRSMFTMWAALPAPLILSADLRPGAPCGGIDDPAIMEILTNAEVIAINQDEAAFPMTAVRRAEEERCVPNPTCTSTAVLSLSLSLCILAPACTYLTHLLSQDDDEEDRKEILADRARVSLNRLGLASPLLLLLLFGFREQLFTLSTLLFAGASSPQPKPTPKPNIPSPSPPCSSQVFNHRYLITGI